MRPTRGLALVAFPLVLLACNPAASATPAAPAATATPAPTARPTPNAASAPIALSVVSCLDSTKQLCDPAAVVTVWTEAALTVDFTASPGHCSPMIAHVTVDGGTDHVSGTLEAGAATGPIDLGPVAPGPHIVAVQAEGVEGGCNHGGVQSWSGSIVLGITAGADPYPTPMLGTPAP